MTLTPIAERFYYMSFRFRSVVAGIRKSNASGGLCQTSLVPLEIVRINETSELLKHSIVIDGGIS